MVSCDDCQFWVDSSIEVFPGELVTESLGCIVETSGAVDPLSIQEEPGIWSTNAFEVIVVHGHPGKVEFKP